MIIDTSMGMKLHQYRLEQLRHSAGEARLIDDLPKGSRSFKLGSYRLILTREATAHVPRMV